MLASAVFHPHSTNCSANPLLPPKLPQIQISPTPKSPSIFPYLQPPSKGKVKSIRISASSSSITQEESAISDDKNGRSQGKEKLGVVVKPVERSRLVLKFVWMEKNIGLAIDQVIQGGHGTIPMTPYYFWPREDAWEELKAMLERKPWISKKQMVVLLNQATEVINLWQQSGGELA